MISYTEKRSDQVMKNLSRRWMWKYMSLDKYLDYRLSLEAYLWSWQCDLRK